MSALGDTVIPILCISAFGPRIESNNRKTAATLQMNHWDREGWSLPWSQIILEDWPFRNDPDKHVLMGRPGIHICVAFTHVDGVNFPQHVWHITAVRGGRGGTRKYNFWPEEMSFSMSAAVIVMSMWTLWALEKCNQLIHTLLLLVRRQARCMAGGTPKKYGAAPEKFTVSLLFKDKA